MRVVAFALLLIVAACAQNTTVTAAHSIKTINAAIEASFDITKRRALAGDITKKEACTVDQYGGLASEIVDQAEVALIRRDLDSVRDYIKQASEALDGISEAAQRAKDDHCGGN